MATKTTPKPITRDDLRERGMLIKLQGREYITHEGLVALAHEQAVESIHTNLLEHDAEARSAVVVATVTMPGPRVFMGLGDCAPKNTNRGIADHYIRMAETRAVSRALRLALGLGITSLEELGGRDDEPEPPRKPAPRKPTHTAETPVGGFIDALHDRFGLDNDEIGKVLRDLERQHKCEADALTREQLAVAWKNLTTNSK